MNKNYISRIRVLWKKIGFDLFRPKDPTRVFHSDHYLRHNARRLEHLASLGIPVAEMSILEVGAGIGDHSHYYLDRNCRITITEARPENVRFIKKRYPGCDVRILDLERPAEIETGPFEICHCYGLLYHLSDPARAIEYLSRYTTKMMFLETCVTFGDKYEINPIHEERRNPSQACSGTGCRPTRAWLYETLKKYFEYVYLPKTQPNHEEFPIDWNASGYESPGLHRAIFVASRERLDNPKLTMGLVVRQTRHE